jgi:O-Antigen ligase
VPLALIGAVYFSPKHLVSPQTELTGLVALIVVLAATRRPDLSLLALIAFLPFQGLVLAKLWAWGLPASVDSHLGAWKESLAIGVVLAGVRNLMATRRPLDTVDRLALSFVLIVALYAVLQPVIVPGSPAASNIRLLGFRETGGFVLLLFGARHAPLGEGFLRRAARVAFGAGALVAAVGVYEAIFSSAWNHFVVHTIKYTQYQAAVLHSPAANPNDIRVYGTVGGTRIVRIGSVFLNQLSCAWYLILPFAIGVERAVRRSASSLTLLATVAIGAALLLTQTRSAILGALVVLFLAFQPAAGRPRHWRTQVAIVLGALALLAIPVVFGTSLGSRVASAGNSSNQSTAGHISGFWDGVDTIGRHPLGLGLGTGAGTGQRFDVKGDVVAENNYLEVGDELGVIPGIMFAALTIALLVVLRRAARRRDELLPTAVWAAGAGLAVAAWFLQTWSDFAVAWTFWGLAGAALGLASQRAPVTSGAGEREPVGRERRGGAALPGELGGAPATAL